MASNKSYSQQIKAIKEDVRQTTNKITRDLAKEAKKDMEKASWNIIFNYYDSYYYKNINRTKYYFRTFNLYNMFSQKHPIDDGIDNGHKASLTVTSLFMLDNYGSKNHRITPDNVFDLVWNAGHRGLPYQSLPSWYPEIEYDGEKYHSNTPHNLMTLFVDRWGKDFGKKKSKSIGDKYKNNNVITF